MMTRISVILLFSYVVIFSPFASAQADSPKIVRNQGYAETEACQPVRPEAAAKNTKARTVKFAFLVDEDGKVQQSKLTKSSGDKILDQAALDAWTKCVFHPASLDGHARISWVMLSYKWQPVMAE